MRFPKLNFVTGALLFVLLTVLAVFAIAKAADVPVPILNPAPSAVELDKGEALTLLNAEYQVAIYQAEAAKVRAEIYQRHNVTPDRYSLDARLGRLIPVAKAQAPAEATPGKPAK